MGIYGGCGEEIYFRGGPVILLGCGEEIYLCGWLKKICSFVREKFKKKKP